MADHTFLQEGEGEVGELGWAGVVMMLRAGIWSIGNRGELGWPLLLWLRVIAFRLLVFAEELGECTKQDRTGQARITPVVFM